MRLKHSASMNLGFKFDLAGIACPIPWNVFLIFSTSDSSGLVMNPSHDPFQVIGTTPSEVSQGLKWASSAYPILALTSCRWRVGLVPATVRRQKGQSPLTFTKQEMTCYWPVKPRPRATTTSWSTWWLLSVILVRIVGVIRYWLLAWSKAKILSK